jgi:hypothetical protein
MYTLLHYLGQHYNHDPTCLEPLPHIPLQQSTEATQTTRLPSIQLRAENKATVSAEQKQSMPSNLNYILQTLLSDIFTITFHIPIPIILLHFKGLRPILYWISIFFIKNKVQEMMEM